MNTDLALLVLRLAVGALVAGHGARRLFGASAVAASRGPPRSSPASGSGRPPFGRSWPGWRSLGAAC